VARKTLQLCSEGGAGHRAPRPLTPPPHLGLPLQPSMFGLTFEAPFVSFCARARTGEDGLLAIGAMTTVFALLLADLVYLCVAHFNQFRKYQMALL